MVFSILLYLNASQMDSLCNGDKPWVYTAISIIDACTLVTHTLHFYASLNVIFKYKSITY